MVDVHTREQRSFNMSQILARDTKPELALRRLLFSKGLRGYRLNTKIIGKPDIVYSRKKLAIFVDGCFWHKCPKCFNKPATNKKFWNKKISDNVKRDERVNAVLKDQGWVVVRFWEHDIKKDLNRCSLRIERILKKA